MVEGIVKKELISPFRTIAHWLLAPIILIIYAIVAFYGLMEVVVSGKKVCSHDASDKNKL